MSSIIFLLDTCVLSELIRPAPNTAVTEWIGHQHEHNLYIPSLAIGEMKKGIELLDIGPKRTRLEAWLPGLVERFSGRVPSFDTDAALLWGNLSARMQRAGTPRGVVDSQLAAIALSRSMTFVTRNILDFEPLGVPLFNPWDLE